MTRRATRSLIATMGGEKTKSEVSNACILESDLSRVNRKIKEKQRGEVRLKLCPALSKTQFSAKQRTSITLPI